MALADTAVRPDESRLHAPGPVRAMLTQLSAGKASGALTVSGHPGGVIFLVDGTVRAVESVAAPGVGELLIGRGRVTREEWDSAVGSAGPGALVDSGRLSGAELELCALEALHDAAYFALGTDPAELRFHPDAVPPPGSGHQVDAVELCDGVDRQRRALDAVHPFAGNDTAVVVPVPRPGADRVLLSGLQWQIVLHADGTRTPTDLAKLLGRPAYAVILDVRRLVTAGLVRRPPTGDRRPAGDRAAVSRPKLPRRVPGQSLTDPPTTGHIGRRRAKEARALSKVPGMAAPAADESMLLRIRAALDALR